MRSHGFSFILPSFLPSFLCAHLFAQTELSPCPVPVKSVSHSLPLLMAFLLSSLLLLLLVPCLILTSPPTPAFQSSSLCPTTPSIVSKSFPSFLFSAHLIRLDCVWLAWHRSEAVLSSVLPRCPLCSQCHQAYNTTAKTNSLQGLKANLHWFSVLPPHPVPWFPCKQKCPHCRTGAEVLPRQALLGQPRHRLSLWKRETLCSRV